jgi:hypothetical protein
VLIRSPDAVKHRTLVSTSTVAEQHNNEFSLYADMSAFRLIPGSLPLIPILDVELNPPPAVS